MRNAELSLETSRASIASAEIDLAYSDIMASAPAFGMAIFHSRTTRGGLLEFDNRPWLIPIYLDPAAFKVISKCSQVGMSDFNINVMLAKAMRGSSTLYVLPRQTDVYNFTPRRVDRLIGWSPFYRAHCSPRHKESDNKTQKTLFGVDCFFVGAESQENFYEKAADGLILDEFDKLNKANLPYAADRIASSPDPWGIKTGNPISRDSGIDYELEQSDCKIWHVKCPACNEWQKIDWLVNCVRQNDDGTWYLLDPNGPVCCKCAKPIDRLMPGEWIAKYPGRDVSGYGEINKVFANPLPNTIANMFEEFVKGETNPGEAQRFFNNVLGLPFEGDGVCLSFEMLSACATAQSQSEMAKLDGPVVAGCDVGKVLHLHISKLHDGRRYKLFCGTVRDFDELTMRCNMLGVDKGVIDAQPEGHAVDNFMRANKRWYRCFYNLQDNNPQDMVVDHKTKTVRVNKTKSCDTSYAAWAQGDIMLPANWQALDKGDFLAQMTAPTRVLVEHKSDSSKDRWEWQEGSKPDHHFHADNYERIAAGLYGLGNNLVTVV